VRGDDPLCALASRKVEKKPLDPTRVSSIAPKTPKPSSPQLSKTKPLDKGEVETSSCPGPRKSPYYTHITMVLGTGQ